jgi:hypothetical protein
MLQILRPAPKRGLRQIVTRIGTEIRGRGVAVAGVEVKIRAEGVSGLKIKVVAGARRTWAGGNGSKWLFSLPSYLANLTVAKM